MLQLIRISMGEILLKFRAINSIQLHCIANCWRECLDLVQTNFPFSLGFNYANGIWKALGNKFIFECPNWAHHIGYGWSVTLIHYSKFIPDWCKKCCFEVYVENPPSSREVSSARWNFIFHAGQWTLLDGQWTLLSLSTMNDQWMETLISTFPSKKTNDTGLKWIFWHDAVNSELGNVVVE